MNQTTNKKIDFWIPPSK